MSTSPLYAHTTLLHSPILSTRADSKVYLKLENSQPSGSFKSRGISCFLKSVHDASSQTIHPIMASGGNAGLACATSSLALALPKCTIVVPQTTGTLMRNRLSSLSSPTTQIQVIVNGESWAEANLYAIEMANRINSDDSTVTTEKAIIVPPFDDPKVVEGNSTMVKEIQDQLKVFGHDRPDGVLVAVGGGGLIAGIFRGLKEVGWDDVPVAAFEPVGAASFYESLKASNKDRKVNLQTLPSISTISGSLGAKRVSEESVERALRRTGDVINVIVSDKLTVQVVDGFARDHQILVEPACGALAPFYSSTLSAPTFLKTLFPSKINGKQKVLVIIVCGGSGVDIDIINTWKKQFADEKEGEIKFWSRDIGDLNTTTSLPN